jgi:RNA-dependent RNA polymerase
VLLLEAVRIKELEYLENVVVFPQLGSRPHQNESSGGDLDGDVFFICWDEELTPKKSELPMKFDTKKRDPIKEVKIENVCDFFVEYIENDKLGIIANSLLAQSDSEHPMTSTCVQLAELSSIAVDYAKNGVPVKNFSKLVPKFYPHFMEKAKKKSYHSKKILGQLYDKIKIPGKPLVTKIEFNKEYLKDGYKKYLEDAEILREMYKVDMKELFYLFDVEEESEILTGTLIYDTKLQRTSNRFDMHKQMNERLIAFLEKFRSLFSENLKEISDGKKKWSAWYCVTYRELNKEFPCLSFPWIVESKYWNV